LIEYGVADLPPSLRGIRGCLFGWKCETLIHLVSARYASSTLVTRAHIAKL
jgi:hypothetical protein